MKLTPSDDQKLKTYEDVLHAIHVYSQVSLDYDKLGNIHENISRWSYAHRVGNGEISEESQQILINCAFWDLLKIGNKG